MPPKKAKVQKIIIEDEDDEDEVEVESASDKDEIEDDLGSQGSDEDDEEEIDDEELADDRDDDFDEEEDCFLKDATIIDDVVEETFFEEIKSLQIPDDERMSSHKMTRYEYNRIIGTRTQQLVSNAKPMIHDSEGLDYSEIALMEIHNNVCPFKIKRPQFNGKYEIWKLSELKKDHLI